MIKICEEAHPIKLTSKLSEIYAAAFAQPPYKKTLRESEAFAVGYEEITRRTAFKLVVARDDQKPVGFAFGYHLRPEYGWYRVLGPILTQAGHSKWLEDAFCLAEMAVLPNYWGKSIGGRLHDELLQGLRSPHFLLSTMHSNETNAIHMYRGRGWKVLLDHIWVSEVDRKYMVLGKTADS
ncbi:MAG: GNAT family N-acetyltransferase [Chloroflexota bacterium]